MKNVLLVSEQGVTSHLFLGEAKRVAETRRAALHFTAAGCAELAPELLAEQDLILFTPQAAAVMDTLHTTAIMAVIPNDIYGWLNSEALVKFATKELAATAVLA